VGNKGNGTWGYCVAEKRSTIRNFWRLARVERIPGADGRVCAAIAKVGSSDNRLSY